MTRRIAIVEDNADDARLLKNYIDRYDKEENERCQVKIFKDGIDLLSNYNENFDVIFLDIEMPILSGMDTARKIREINDTVCLIFVTNMAQYAVEGYEVKALDFMIKPVGYFNLSNKLTKALAYADKRKEREILITKDDNLVRLPVSKIYYIEKDVNDLVYTTEYGVFTQRGTMQQLESELHGFGFSKSISGCLINMKHVFKTTKNSVFVNGKELPISRKQRKEFMSNLFDYLRGGGTPE